MLKYQLTITQKGPEGDNNFKNVIACTDPEEIYRKLAHCYRDINRAERAPAIIRGKHWIANPYDSEKRKHCFIIEYDVFMNGKTISVYNWEFEGVDRD